MVQKKDNLKWSVDEIIEHERQHDLNRLFILQERCPQYGWIDYACWLVIVPFVLWCLLMAFN